MSETIRVLVPEEKVDERIRELGKQISEDYAGKQVHSDLCAQGRRILYVRAGKTYYRAGIHGLYVRGQLRRRDPRQAELCVLQKTLTNPLKIKKCLS